MVHRQVVHDHRRRSPPALRFQPHDEWEEGVHGVTPSKGLCMHKALMNAQGANHRYGLPSLVWQLHTHSLFDP